MPSAGEVFHDMFRDTVVVVNGKSDEDRAWIPSMSHLIGRDVKVVSSEDSNYVCIKDLRNGNHYWLHYKSLRPKGEGND